MWTRISRIIKAVRFLAVGLPTLAASAAGPAHAADDNIAWGINGHPIAAYYGIPVEKPQSISCAIWVRARIALTSWARTIFRSCVSSSARRRRAASGVVLPVITPVFDIEKSTPDELQKLGYDIAFALVSAFRSEMTSWELGDGFRKSRYHQAVRDA